MTHMCTLELEKNGLQTVRIERVKTKDKEIREKGRRWCGLRSGTVPVK